MKYSLEKVIDAMEQRQEKEDWDIRHDAIEYLKDYKESKGFQEYGEYLLDKERNELKKAMERTEDYRLMYIHAMANEMDNPELTWEQLEKMEGKPVWIEYDNQSFETLSPSRRWAVVCIVDNVGMNGPEASFCGKGRPFWMQKESLGIHWNAYKKERE